MSDPELREAERQGELPLAEQVALLNARRRAGELAERDLLLAAYAGDLAAQATLGLPRRAAADEARADHTRVVLGVRWAAVELEAPDDPFVQAAAQDPVLKRLCPRWTGADAEAGALVLAATEPSVTGFLLQARSGGALGVRRGQASAGREHVRVPQGEDVAAAIAAAREQVEAEGLRFVAEGEALQRELLELGDWRAPRIVETWLAGFGFFGAEARLRAQLALALASLQDLPAAERAAALRLLLPAFTYAIRPSEVLRAAALAIDPELTPSTSDEELALPRARARRAWELAAKGESEGLDGEELALLEARDRVTRDLRAWALEGRDPLPAQLAAMRPPADARSRADDRRARPD